MAILSAARRARRPHAGYQLPADSGFPSMNVGEHVSISSRHRQRAFIGFIYDGYVPAAPLPGAGRQFL
jgi:hypothetical protein